MTRAGRPVGPQGEREAVVGAPVAFFEVISPDSAGARRFYSELFGWTMTGDPSWGDYVLIDTHGGEGAIGGGMGQADERSPAGVKVYVHVDDLAAFLARAEELGGKTLVPPSDLPEGYGRIAVLAGPDGIQVGLWS